MKNKLINLDNSVIIKEVGETKFLSISISDNTFVKSNIKRLLHIVDTLRESREYFDISINPEYKKYENEINIDMSFPFLEYLKEIPLKIKKEFENFDIRVLRETEDFLYLQLDKCRYSREEIMTILEKLISENLENVGKNTKHLTLRYSFYNKSDLEKSSEIKFFVENRNNTEKMTSGISISNHSKFIKSIVMKRAVNRLSVLSNKLNEGFPKLGKRKSSNKIMHVERRNAFELIDKAILESIIKEKD